MADLDISLRASAAYGEVNFEMVGFVCQCLALCFEASRLVMIEILLHGMKVGFAATPKYPFQ